MKTYPFAILAVLPALIVCGACRQPKSGTAAPTLTVEFDDPYAASPIHTDLTDSDENSFETHLDSLRPLNAAAPPSTDGTLSLHFTANAGKVITTVYKIPPDTDPLRYSDGHKRLLGTHSARLNETVTLDELKNIGYEPFAIRIVKARPRQVAHPALVSKVPSIQLAIGAPPHSFDGDTPSCSVVLHNKSSRGVIAYVLSDGGDPKTGDTQSRESFGSFNKPAIDPEKDSHPDTFSFAHATKMTPQQVVLEAALFSDGTYEGEHKVAAHLKAREIENLAFYRVITPPIDRIVADSSINDDTRVARIKNEIFRISSQPDAATLHSLEAKFPDVDPADLATDLTRGTDAAKEQIWSDLYGYVNNCCQYPPPDHISVPEWWQHQRSRIETYLQSRDREGAVTH